MTRLDERLSEFAAALLDPARPTPAGLVGPDGQPSAKRFNVYRNNVVVGLIETLKAAFPAVNRIVGNEFFAAMARIYVLREPPHSPIMLNYGAGFVDFVGGFEPAAAIPYLRDVAALERAWVEAYHAAEGGPFDAATLAGVAPDQLPNIQLALHPSVRIIRSSFPAVTIWRMNIEDAVPSAVDLDAGGEDALVVRPIAEVEVRLLPDGAATFIEALAAGTPIVGALDSALLDEPRFSMSGTLAGLLEAGAIVGWNAAETAVREVLARSA